MTFEEEITSNECNSKKEKEFEDFLKEEFLKLESDYDGLDRSLETLKQNLPT